MSIKTIKFKLKYMYKIQLIDIKINKFYNILNNYYNRLNLIIEKLNIYVVDIIKIRHKIKKMLNKIIKYKLKINNYNTLLTKNINKKHDNEYYSLKVLLYKKKIIKFKKKIIIKLYKLEFIINDILYLVIIYNKYYIISINSIPKINKNIKILTKELNNIINNIIDKKTLILYISIRKRINDNIIISLVDNCVPNISNIFIPAQKYCDLFNKDKFIFDEYNGKILIDVEYANIIKKELNKTIFKKFIYL